LIFRAEARRFLFPHREGDTRTLRGSKIRGSRSLFEIVARVRAINENKASDSVPFVCACRFICYLRFSLPINNSSLIEY